MSYLYIAWVLLAASPTYKIIRHIHLILVNTEVLTARLNHVHLL